MDLGLMSVNAALPWVASSIHLRMKLSLALIAHVAALIARECITEAKDYTVGHGSPAPNRGVVLLGTSIKSPE